MRCRWMILAVAAAPLLCAAIWLDEQPSYRPQEAPVVMGPVNSVPVTGKEIVPEGDLKNPLPADAASLARGKALFEINCAMCHGSTSAKRGGVGTKLTPPPPALEPAMVQALTDTVIFRAITAGFGRMPPFQSKLKPQDRWHLVNYLRTRR